MARITTEQTLKRQSAEFRNSGGVSEENRKLGFRPAFLDLESGQIHESSAADGTPAPIHTLDGLPHELVAMRSTHGKPKTIKSSVIAGFVREGKFYTREQAVEAVKNHKFGVE